MVDKAICDMKVSELESLILNKELEYREAIESQKVFWEIKEILEQKRKFEKEVIKKTADALH